MHCSSGWNFAHGEDNEWGVPAEPSVRSSPTLTQPGDLAAACYHRPTLLVILNENLVSDVLHLDPVTLRPESADKSTAACTRPQAKWNKPALASPFIELHLALNGTREGFLLSSANFKVPQSVSHVLHSPSLWKTSISVPSAVWLSHRWEQLVIRKKKGKEIWIAGACACVCMSGHHVYQKHRE